MWLEGSRRSLAPHRVMAAHRQGLVHLYGLTPAALLVEHDAAIPLFAMLDRADVSEIEHLVRVLREELNA